jgi:hypothetical protein
MGQHRTGNGIHEIARDQINALDKAGVCHITLPDAN